ncbi:PARAQUAT RESISTANT 2, S-NITROSOGLUTATHIONE REDUCTASE, ALCOHOL DEHYDROGENASE 2 [Hibiscus trionum]|uniref:PARAQUAT RESISTANT 2, S-NITROSOGLUTATHIONE REDUCTASE, ALCOHOL DEHYDROGENASE 2 n=1 Tax=Hibiscus trionum TaxID=183268 RepID=A0A9W7MNZ2_HIBTR|nr:PARAQUAT RESISTANT 2, S-NITROSOGLUTATHIONE REDUCTASE, ALCOHOL DEHYDROGENASE 2 [Hibiscus trionum]
MSTTNSKTITCKGIVSWGKDEALKVEEVQVEPPKSFEVRLKMLYASVCHSDMLLASGFPIPSFPRVLGHEGVGVVESIGEGVTGLREGDLVIPTYVAECKTCEICMSEKSNLCIKYPLSYTGLMPDGTSRMSIGAQTAYHEFTCSTWCQYTVINVNFVVKIDPQIPLSDASFLSCGFSTGYGAAWKEAKVEHGSSVAVFGLGAVGLGAIKGAKSGGASRIIGIDKNPRKEAKGRAFGMTDFINPEESDKSIEELVRDLSGGMGVDYSFECTGVPSLINQAIQSTKPGVGKIIQIGAGAGEESNVNINILGIIMGKTLKGTIFGGIKVRSELPIIYEKCKNREIQLDELLTHEIKLEDAYKVFELLKQPDCVKILIKI